MRSFGVIGLKTVPLVGLTVFVLAATPATIHDPAVVSHDAVASSHDDHPAHGQPAGTIADKHHEGVHGEDVEQRPANPAYSLVHWLYGIVLHFGNRHSNSSHASVPAASSHDAERNPTGCTTVPMDHGATSGPHGDGRAHRATPSTAGHDSTVSHTSPRPPLAKQ